MPTSQLAPSPRITTIGYDPISADETPGQLSGTPVPSQSGSLTPTNRVAHTRVALVRALRTHLLPLLDRDLDAVVVHTGVTRESLRKLRAALRARGGTDRLPTADALASIVTAFGWSLDGLLDPACADPAAPRAPAPLARGAADAFAVRAALVLRHAAADANDPDAAELPRRPEVLVGLFDRGVRQLYAAARADRLRARAVALEQWCSAALARLERDDAVWRATADAPSLGRTAAVYATRLRQALTERRRDEATGEVRAGDVVVRASDPWELVRDIGPAVERLLAQDMALTPLIGVSFEFTDAEVRTARAVLRQDTIQRDGHRQWHPDAVIAAYTRLLDQRGYPPGLVQPLGVTLAAMAAQQADVVNTGVMLNEVFAPYCEAIGAAWDAAARCFLVVGPGHGAFDGVLISHHEEARLVIDAAGQPSADLCTSTTGTA